MRDDYPNGSKKPETNEIVTQLSHEERRVLEVIQGLLEPCGQRSCAFGSAKLTEKGKGKQQLNLESQCGLCGG